MSSLVNATRMVPRHDWEAISRDVSTSIIERLPVLSSMVSDTTTVTYRGDTSRQAICVRTTGVPESCAAQPRPDQRTPYISAQAQIGGHWLIFGYHDGSDGGIDAARQNAMTFIDPGGHNSKPDWVHNAAGDWYVTAIPDGVDTVVTNQGQILGGVSGSLFRTFVPSVLV